jgi:hypothetical protein
MFILVVCPVVQRTGGFIKEHDRRFAQQSASNQQALALPKSTPRLCVQ